MTGLISSEIVMTAVLLSVKSLSSSAADHPVLPDGSINIR